MSEGSYSNSFYAIIGASICGIAASGYYLFSLFKRNEKSFEMSKEDPDISLCYKGKLTQERALKLMALIHNKTESFIEKSDPTIEKRRRDNLNNSEIYEKICSELMELKHVAFSTITKEVEQRYGYSYEEISHVVEPIGPIDMEEKLLNYSSPRFNDQVKITKQLVHDAFIFYANLCIQQMHNVYGLLRESSIDQKQKEYFLYQLMILKFKADDELFLKYQFTESQLKYLLFQFKLQENSKIKELLNKICEYEELFT